MASPKGYFPKEPQPSHDSAIQRREYQTMAGKLKARRRRIKIRRDFTGFGWVQYNTSYTLAHDFKCHIAKMEQEEKQLEEEFFKIEGLTCSQCLLTFSSGSHLEKHTYFCGNSLLQPGETEFLNENEEMLLEPSSGMLLCPWCPLLCSNMSALHRHIRNCKDALPNKTVKEIVKELPCPECPSVYLMLDSLMSHLYVHYISDVKCVPCNEPFLTVRCLMSHLTVCKSKGLYVCCNCSSVFVNATALRVHLASCKSGTQCLKCAEVVIDRDRCMDHMTAHLTSEWAKKGLEMIDGVLYRQHKDPKSPFKGKERKPSAIPTDALQRDSVSEKSSEGVCHKVQSPTMNMSFSPRQVKSKQDHKIKKKKRKFESSRKVSNEDVPKVSKCIDSVELNSNSSVKSSQTSRLSPTTDTTKYCSTEKEEHILGDAGTLRSDLPLSYDNRTCDEIPLADEDNFAVVENEVYEIENVVDDIDNEFTNEPEVIHRDQSVHGIEPRVVLREPVKSNLNPNLSDITLFTPAVNNCESSDENELKLTVVNVEGGANFFNWDDDCDVDKEDNCNIDINCKQRKTLKLSRALAGKFDDSSLIADGQSDGNEDDDSGIDGTEDRDSNRDLTEDLDTFCQVAVRDTLLSRRKQFDKPVEYEEVVSEGTSPCKPAVPLEEVYSSKDACSQSRSLSEMALLHGASMFTDLAISCKDSASYKLQVPESCESTSSQVAPATFEVPMPEEVTVSGEVVVSSNNPVPAEVFLFPHLYDMAVVIDSSAASQPKTIYSLLEEHSYTLPGHSQHRSRSDKPKSKPLSISSTLDSGSSTSIEPSKKKMKLQKPPGATNHTKAKTCLAPVHKSNRPKLSLELAHASNMFSDAGASKPEKKSKREQKRHFLTLLKIKSRNNVPEVLPSIPETNKTSAGNNPQKEDVLETVSSEPHLESLPTAAKSSNRFVAIGTPLSTSCFPDISSSINQSNISSVSLPSHEDSTSPNICTTNVYASSTSKNTIVMSGETQEPVTNQTSASVNFDLPQSKCALSTAFSIIEKPKVDRVIEKLGRDSLVEKPNLYSRMRQKEKSMLSRGFKQIATIPPWRVDLSKANCSTNSTVGNSSLSPCLLVSGGSSSTGNTQNSAPPNKSMDEFFEASMREIIIELIENSWKEPVNINPMVTDDFKNNIIEIMTKYAKILRNPSIYASEKITKLPHTASLQREDIFKLGVTELFDDLMRVLKMPSSIAFVASNTCKKTIIKPSNTCQVIEKNLTGKKSSFRAIVMEAALKCEKRLKESAKSSIPKTSSSTGFLMNIVPNEVSSKCENQMNKPAKSSIHKAINAAAPFMFVISNDAVTNCENQLKEDAISSISKASSSTAPLMFVSNKAASNCEGQFIKSAKSSSYKASSSTSPSMCVVSIEAVSNLENQLEELLKSNMPKASSSAARPMCVVSNEGASKCKNLLNENAKSSLPKASSSGAPLMFVVSSDGNLLPHPNFNSLSAEAAVSSKKNLPLPPVPIYSTSMCSEDFNRVDKKQIELKQNNRLVTLFEKERQVQGNHEKLSLNVNGKAREDDIVKEESSLAQEVSSIPPPLVPIHSPSKSSEDFIGVDGKQIELKQNDGQVTPFDKCRQVQDEHSLDVHGKGRENDFVQEESSLLTSTTSTIHKLSGIVTNVTPAEQVSSKPPPLVPIYSPSKSSEDFIGVDGKQIELKQSDGQVTPFDKCRRVQDEHSLDVHGKVRENDFVQEESSLLTSTTSTIHKLSRIVTNVTPAEQVSSKPPPLVPIHSPSMSSEDFIGVDGKQIELKQNDGQVTPFDKCRRVQDKLSLDVRGKAREDNIVQEESSLLTSTTSTIHKLSGIVTNVTPAEQVSSKPPPLVPIHSPSMSSEDFIGVDGKQIELKQNDGQVTPFDKCRQVQDKLSLDVHGKARQDDILQEESSILADTVDKFTGIVSDLISVHEVSSMPSNSNSEHHNTNSSDNVSLNFVDKSKQCLSGGHLAEKEKKLLSRKKDSKAELLRTLQSTVPNLDGYNVVLMSSDDDDDSDVDVSGCCDTFTDYKDTDKEKSLSYGKGVKIVTDIPEKETSPNDCVTRDSPILVSNTTSEVIKVASLISSDTHDAENTAALDIDKSKPYEVIGMELCSDSSNSGDESKQEMLSCSRSQENLLPNSPSTFKPMDSPAVVNRANFESNLPGDLKVLGCPKSDSRVECSTVSGETAKDSELKKPSFHKDTSKTVKRQRLLTHFRTSMFTFRKLMPDIKCFKKKRRGREGLSKSISASVINCAHCSQWFYSQMDLECHVCLIVLIRDKFTSGHFDRFFNGAEEVECLPNSSPSNGIKPSELLTNPLPVNEVQLTEVLQNSLVESNIKLTESLPNSSPEIENKSPLEMYLQMKTHIKKWNFTCEKCQLKCKNFSALLEHKSSVHSEKSSVQCHVCGKEFSRLQKLAVHFAKSHRSSNSKTSEGETVDSSHSGSVPEKCPSQGGEEPSCSDNCKKSEKGNPTKKASFGPGNTSQKASPTENSDSDTKTNAHHCHTCNKSFNGSSGLKSHINQTHRELFKCPVCLRRFSYLPKLKIHFKQYHATTAEPAVSIISSESVENLSLSNEENRHEQEEVPLEKNLKSIPAASTSICSATGINHVSEINTDSVSATDSKVKKCKKTKWRVVKDSSLCEDTSPETPHKSAKLSDDKDCSLKSVRPLVLSLSKVIRSRYKCHNCNENFKRQHHLLLHNLEVHKDCTQWSCPVCHVDLSNFLHLQSHLKQCEGKIKPEDTSTENVELCPVSANDLTTPVPVQRGPPICNSGADSTNSGQAHLDQPVEKVDAGEESFKGESSSTSAKSSEIIAAVVVGSVEKASEPVSDSSLKVVEPTIEMSLNVAAVEKVCAPKIDNEISPKNSESLLEDSSVAQPRSSAIDKPIAPVSDPILSNSLKNDSKDHGKIHHEAVSKNISTEQDASQSPTQLSSDKINWRCEECNQDFHLKGFLERHNIKTHGAPSKFNCPLCDKFFVDKRSLRFHHKQKHKDNESLPSLPPDTALTSSISLRSSDAVQNDTSVNDEGNITQGSKLKGKMVRKCSLCEKIFRRAIDLRRHKKRQHKRPPFIKCHPCKLQFDSKDLLATHCAQVHAADLKANTCDSSASRNPRDIIYGNNSKEGSKIEQTTQRNCDGEGTSELENSCDSEHQEGKSKDSDESEVFKCEDCPLTYKLFSCLKRHRILMHAEPASHYCKVCGKGFSYPHSLKNHMMSHSWNQQKWTSERPGRLLRLKSSRSVRNNAMEEFISRAQTTKAPDSSKGVEIAENDESSTNHAVFPPPEKSVKIDVNGIPAPIDKEAENHNTLSSALIGNSAKIQVTESHAPIDTEMGDNFRVTPVAVTANHSAEDKILKYSKLEDASNQENENSAFGDNCIPFNNAIQAQLVGSSRNIPVNNGDMNGVSLSSFMSVNVTINNFTESNNQWAQAVPPSAQFMPSFPSMPPAPQIPSFPSFEEFRAFNACSLCGLCLPSWYALQEHYYTVHPYPNFYPAPAPTPYHAPMPHAAALPHAAPMPYSAPLEYTMFHREEPIHNNWLQPPQAFDFGNAPPHVGLDDGTASFQELTSRNVAHCSVCGVCFQSLFALQEHYATHMASS